MDKLQPLIRHRYWICFGLAVIFVFTGWWLASASLAAEIEANRKLVTDSFTKAGSNATDPNQSWVDAAKKLNEQDKIAFDKAAGDLRTRQKNARQWPESVRDEMKGIAYQAPITNSLSREKWASIYKDEIEALLEIVKPFRNGEGLVVVTPNRVTHRPFDAWRTSVPQSKEIWDAQEDIWLLRSLLTSVSNVNGNATRITESSVREILKLSLRGGDKDAKPGAAGGGGAGGGMQESGMMMMSMSGGSSGGSGGLGGSTDYPGKEFEGASGADILVEEFGACADPGLGTGGAGGGSGGGMGKMGSMSMMSSGATEMQSGGVSGEGGGADAVPRYVHEEENSYKTRAFLLDVKVRDDKIPELLAALTDSDFPVEIVRVEIVTAGGSSGPMGGGSGMPGKGMSSGMSGGMQMGSGMGMGEGMSGLGSEGSGLEEPGLGSAGMMSGDPGSMAGMGTQMGPGAGKGMGMGMGMSGGMAGAKGQEALAIAMADPLLVTVRIGGLMTLYQSAEESTAAAATEAAGASEQTAAPVTPPADPATTATDAAPADGSTPAADTTATPPTTGAETPAEGTTAENSAPTEGAAPAEGTTPAEGSAPAGEGTSETTPTTGSEAATPPADGSSPATPEPGTDTGAGGTPEPTTPPAGEGTSGS